MASAHMASAHIAYMKWLAEGVKPPDSWTEQELEAAYRATDFTTEQAKTFFGGFQYGRVYQLDFQRRHTA